MFAFGKPNFRLSGQKLFLDFKFPFKILAEAAPRHADAHWRLPALVLVAVDHLDGAADNRLVEAHRRYLGDCSVVFDVGFDDGVQDFVRR